jgi:hypothetical protein
MKKLFTFLMVAVFALACSNLFAQTKATKMDFKKGGLRAATVKVSPINGICGPCAIPENEPPIGSDGIDVTNAGCFETPNNFSPLNMGDVYCSHVNNYLYLGTDQRTDLDWYRFVLTETKTVYYSVAAPFQGQIYVFGPPCNNYAFYDGWYFDPNPFGWVFSVTLPAGEYYIVLGTLAYYGNGVEFEYALKLSAENPGPAETWCAPAPIPTLTEWGLIILGFAMLGFGTLYILRWRGTSA